MLNAAVIEGFVNSVLAKKFDDPVPTPQCHREWWELCTGKERYVAIAAPRGFAKSTAITFAYVLAAVLFRDRSFVLIVSDTESQAVLFLQDIKAELQANEDIKQLFGVTRIAKDRETDIIVECDDGHKFRIMAKGSEQKVRGTKWSNKRPDLIVCDDLENDEIVLNKDRREKFKRWFRAALLPARSDNGIVRIIGTILHLDSQLENLMPKSWDKHTVKEELKEYSTSRTAWKSVKYKAHNADFSALLWREKKEGTEEALRAKRQEYVDAGLGDVYSQEFLNVPLDETNTYFRKSDFLPEQDADKQRKLNYYISCDLAISEKQRADYSVFVVAGMDEDRRLFIKNVIRDRMDGREIVNTILGLHNVYKPDFITIEEGAISKAIGPFLYEEMALQDKYPVILPMPNKGEDKIKRARSIQGRMRAGGCRFDKGADWYQEFENELMRFPRDVHDDQVDAFAYLGLALDKLSEAPTQKEVEEEEYEQEYQKSGLYEQGRSQVTGY
jgi:predicted phage terminase large subunit-like protein